METSKAPEVVEREPDVTELVTKVEDAETPTSTELDTDEVVGKEPDSTELDTCETDTASEEVWELANVDRLLPKSDAELVKDAKIEEVEDTRSIELETSEVTGREPDVAEPDVTALDTTEMSDREPDDAELDICEIEAAREDVCELRTVDRLVTGKLDDVESVED